MHRQADYLHELALSKRNKLLPLRASLWIYQFVYRKKALNQCCEVPYWLCFFPAAALMIFLLLITLLQHGIAISSLTLKVIGSVSIIILIQLLASEAVNRKVIHTLSVEIAPPVMNKKLWNKIDAPLREQIIIPILGIVVGLPALVLYASNLFPSIQVDACFIVGLGFVLFNTSYGMFMHIFSSMSLVRMTSHFRRRLYEFFPTGSPVIRHLANLYSTALMITVITSIATISIVVATFPSPIMFKFAAISLISSMGVSIFAFFFHIHSISVLIDSGKEKVIARIQSRINRINATKDVDPISNNNSLEEIGKLLELSEKIQNAKPRILSVNISLKYLISIISPVAALGNTEYLIAIKAILDSLKELL